MNKLEKVLYELNSIEGGVSSKCIIDLRAQLISTLFFLVAMLSLPILDINSLILFIIFPIIECSYSSISYVKIIKRSTIVIPFVFLIGIFNPIFDQRVVLKIFDINITAGWISFISIIFRAMLSTQVVLILIYRSGFNNICHSFQHLGVPSIFTNQLMFAYHYIFIMVQEALSMQRARKARGYGNNNYSFKMWGVIVGQLLLRTMDRASMIHKAMLSRGFSGHIETKNIMKWGINDNIYLTSWLFVFIILRFVNIPSLFSNI